MRLPTDLRGIIKERTITFSYTDLVQKRPSGMTKFQEWLRTQGIKEGKEPMDGYVEIKHPYDWTGKPLLLVPVELAIKIATLGYMP